MFKVVMSFKRCVWSRFILVVISMFLFFGGSNHCGSTDWPLLKGDYLGQKPPGPIPEVFAPGIISHGFHELRLTISPDGNEMFYVTSDKRWYYTIIRLKRDHGIWSEPEVAPFSGKYQDTSPSFSPDGKRLYFCSKRPVRDRTESREDFDIWYVEKSGRSWTEPVNLGHAINDRRDVWDVSVSSHGSMYFEVNDTLYVSRFKDKTYSVPVRLNNGINTGHESSPCIAPDESCLLFQSTRPGGYGGNDLYASFKGDDGLWSEPINMGESVNSASHDFGPRISPDGAYIFFSSGRPLESSLFQNKTYGELLKLYRHPQNGHGTLFWVDAGIIEVLKNRLDDK